MGPPMTNPASGQRNKDHRLKNPTGRKQAASYLQRVVELKSGPLKTDPANGKSGSEHITVPRLRH